MGVASRGRRVSKILIAGCGDVGCALAERLAASGHEVIGVRRQVERLPSTLHAIAADLGEPRTLGALPRDVDMLFYTAAADGFNEAAYRRSYLQGLANVLDALSPAPLTRILFTSSTSVYAQDDGSWVDEDSPTRPVGFSGGILLEAEALGARIAAERGAGFTTVRFGGIYGPGRTRLLERVLGGGGCSRQLRWTNRIHRDDCAGVLAHLAGPGTAMGVCLAVDCEPAPQCQVMDWLASRLQCPPVPRTDDAAGARGGNKRCSNRRLLESGYTFHYPDFREGYTAVLAATA